MKDFFAWLLTKGFVYTRGDIHYNNSGYWYPKPPRDLSVENVNLGGWFIWVEHDRENDAVFIAWRGEAGRDGAYTEDPERAMAVINDAMLRYAMEWDQREERGEGPADGDNSFGAMEEGRYGDLGAPTRGGSIDRFITRWVDDTLGRKTKEGPLSVSVEGSVSALYSYAVPIASIYDRKFLVVSTSEALSRTSMTTNAHLRVVERVVGGYGNMPVVFPSDRTGTITEGRIPIDQHDWEPILVMFDARAEGKTGYRLRGTR